LGQQGTTSNPEELWKAYPLEQRPTTQAPAPAPAAHRPATTASTADDSSGGTLWWVVAAVAAGSALALGAMAMRRRRGRAADREPPESGATTPPWAATPSPSRAPAREPAPAPLAPAKREETAAPPEPEPEPSPEPEPPAPAPEPEPVASPPEPVASPPEPPAPAPEPVASPPEPAPPEPVASPPPARAPRKADPVCQVRWNRSGGFFVAVTAESDGAEREVARSPSVDRNGSSPPEQEPELEVALKVLSKQLRDIGWRPLRAKGFDYDERRWYARRFRWPTEAEAEPGASGQGPPTRVGEQVGMQANKGDA
jgi:hypothetical protein